VVILGGGAAGFFAAANLGQMAAGINIMLVEQGREVLQKVKISGGGRCNVTHACWDPADLVKYYPRGEKELLGPFHKFACGDTVAWFEERAVPLKAEEDGRMFPVSDDSATIVDCLVKNAKKAGTRIYTSHKVNTINVFADGYEVVCPNLSIRCTQLLVATGSSVSFWKLLQGMGYEMVAPVPSLFTFHIQDKALHQLMGLTIPDVELSCEEMTLNTNGPMLITHWGVSGPAVLKMSAAGARLMHEKAYRFDLQIGWTPGLTAEDIAEFRRQKGSATVGGQSPVGLPSRLWKYLVSRAGLSHDKKWAELSKIELEKILTVLTADVHKVNGKSTFKEEFVTAGGVDLRQINFSTFESRLHAGMYFAGEVLDIDAVTGGFNFQAAWTGAYLASKAIANKYKKDKDVSKTQKKQEE
jgi:predicted Rossmann fold flavoprotein